MKFLSKASTTTAALALVACALTAPAAHAGTAAYTPWNTESKTYTSQAELEADHGSELSTITKHDIRDTFNGTDGTNNGQGYWKRDADGNIVYAQDGSAQTNLPTKLNWLIPVYNKYKDNKKVQFWTATSPAMNNREVNLAVITPTGDFDQSRPTIYLLNGAGGADQGMDWITETTGRENANEDVVEFYLKKNVNVVIVQDGAFTYYTDWVDENVQTKYIKGPQKWETFLTKELPSVIEGPDYLNGQRAIAGMSMSATSSLLLAEHNPGFYDAVGSYAGCAATSTLMPRLYTAVTVYRAGTAFPSQMWGPMGSETNIYNDALINSNNLRGSKLYISTSTGLPGENERLSNILSRNGNNLSSGISTASTLIIEGGSIEAAAHDCTVQLKNKLDGEGIEANYNFRPTGTHSWPGWREDLWKSWDTYAEAFGQPTGTDIDPVIGTTPASTDVTDVTDQAAEVDTPAAEDATGTQTGTDTVGDAIGATTDTATDTTQPLGDALDAALTNTTGTNGTTGATGTTE